MRFFKLLAPALFAALPAQSQVSVPCGGSFSSFLKNVRAEALSQGLPKSAVDRFLQGAAQDSRTLSRDRGQGIFQMPFTEFARRVISQNRMDHGRKNAQRHAAIFDEAERRFGVPRGVLLAFWALETDYGAVQGDFNTRNSLLTLSHDCRRPELFQPQVFAAITLTAQGGFDPAKTTGAWAGEIGMVQMLPADILHNGIDGDGDGKPRGFLDYDVVAEASHVWGKIGSVAGDFTASDAGDSVLPVRRGSLGRSTAKIAQFSSDQTAQMQATAHGTLAPGVQKGDGLHDER